MKPVPSTVAKAYPPRGPLRQFRFVSATAYRCFRCGKTKKSKLITIYAEDWSRRLCNGCYGNLLSVYKVKAGTGPDDVRAEQLALEVLKLVSEDDQRRAERLVISSENRARNLSPRSLRFLGTAEHLASKLTAEPYLEWSGAVICLCKAVELEVVNRLIDPLVLMGSGVSMAADKKDRDIGKVAAYCMDESLPSPTLGTFAHFLQTVIHSQRRRKTSALIGLFLTLSSDCTGSEWILDPNGLYASITDLTVRFRNRAAHIDELTGVDYDLCQDLVMGSEGILWNLQVAVEPHR